MSFHLLANVWRMICYFYYNIEQIALSKFYGLSKFLQVGGNMISVQVLN